jgi:parvulin-like peptidyl-prolyl isomerase
LVIAAALAAVPAYGYYDAFVAPLQVQMVRVNNTVITMGDYVERLRYLSVENRLAGTNIDFAADPFRLLTDLRDGELLVQAAPRLGIRPSDTEVTDAIKARLGVAPKEGEAASPEEVERHFQEAYKQYLAQVNLSDQKYRRVVLEHLLRQRVRETLSDRTPAVAEQVRVFGLKVEDHQQALGLRDRILKGEEIGPLARDFSTDAESREARGDLGWLPKRVLPGAADEAVFAARVGDVTEPLLIDRGYWVYQVRERQAARTVEGKAREKLKDRALTDWLEEERKANRAETYFDSDRYEYVIRKVEEYRR